MLISVVTAVRNGAASIGATLASVCEQTHPDVEHVIVDGASTDATVAIVRACAGRSIRLLSEPDAGLYDAFNKGLGMARGDVIAFLNSGDTYWAPGILSRVAAEFAGAPLDAVYGDVAVVDAHDTQRVVRRYHSRRFRPSRLSYGLMPAHPALFLRRSVYERCGGYDASYRIAGDFELVARAFRGPGVRYRYVPEVMVRMPRGGVSSSGLRSNWIITRELQRACRQNGIDTNLFKLALRFPIKLSDWVSKSV